MIRLIRRLITECTISIITSSQHACIHNYQSRFTTFTGSLLSAVHQNRLISPNAYNEFEQYHWNNILNIVIWHFLLLCLPEDNGQIKKTMSWLEVEHTTICLDVSHELILDVVTRDQGGEKKSRQKRLKPSNG